MNSTSSSASKNLFWLRFSQILWLLAVLLNLIVFVIGLFYSYQNAFEGEVFWDIWVETRENTAYVIWTQFSSEFLPDENLTLVTTVSPQAAEAGLQVGDKIRPNWGQGHQNMPLDLRVLHPDGQESIVTLIASEIGTGYYLSSVSEDAAEAGLQVGDMMYGDYVPWSGEAGTEIHFMVLSEGAEAPRTVSLIRKANSVVMKMLMELGFSISSAAILDNVLTGLVILISFALAVFLFLSRSDNWQVLFFAWAMTVIPVIVVDISYIPPIIPAANWSSYATLVNIFVWLVILSFPTGKIYPRWSILLLPLIVLVNLIPSRLFGNSLSWNAFLFLVGLAIVVYRYRWHFNPVQRQQSKWAIYALLLITITQLLPLGSIGLYNLGALQIWEVYVLIVEYFLTTGLLLTATIFIAFAILRYRLYDIDIVINRSLVGFFVTILLLLIFIPSVFLIQSLLGAENTWLSYLVSAAIPVFLFQPTRKRVRHFVDQRIYGLKFDLNELEAAQQKPEIKNAGALTGKRLGQYEVLDFIGKGGMGEVYKGYADGKTVALKTLPIQFANEPDYLRRFQREAEVMQHLEHPKIVKLHGAGESEGLRFLAMDYIEGQELKDQLREKGRLSFENAHTILCDIAEALDYLHSQNIVHRDIKPSNVMLRGDDPQEAVLMDFGIAKIEDGKTRLTGSGAIGTIDYMAPEQIMAAKEVDKRADVYALGVMAYEMFTGERPFKGSAAQVMFAHLQQPVPDPREHNANLSEAMAHSILKALEKQPDNRFGSAGEFVAALV